MKFTPKIIESSKTIQDLVVLEVDRFQDFRGENFEGYAEDHYNKVFSASEAWRNEAPKFVTDSFSRSRQGVVRGFHGDTKAWKLIQVLHGEVWFAVCDLREDSPTHQQVFQTLLGDRNRRQVLVPRGCVNAHQCLTEECVFSYKLTGGYVEPEDQLHTHYSRIDWPIDHSILSFRDR